MGASIDMARHMTWIDVSALALVVIGAINWGLVGFFDYDLVAALLGASSTGSRVVYGLVGIAGLYTIWTTVKAGQDATHRTSTRPM